ncbi:MAG: response regulator [Hyphomicrobiales bacterium]|nr:response regulator [Hyphomicrobiales bacterium]
MLLTLSVPTGGAGTIAIRARLLLPLRAGSGGLPAAGLSLHLAAGRSLVLLMGGTMNLEILCGDDRILSLHLPLVSVPAPLPGSEKQTVSGQGSVSRVLDVMIADDTPSTLHVMTLLLRRQGHNVTAVTNGADAIHAAQAKAFDLCLLDLRMDRVGGIDAALGIRALPAPFGTGAIYALSARIDSNNRRACRAAQMDGCLVKPLLGDELAALLNSVARRQPMDEFTLQRAH